MRITSNGTFIQPKAQTADGRNKYCQLRVAAYCRVSTAPEGQPSSYLTMSEYYKDYITSNPDWTLVGIFTDNGTSNTHFDRMMRMCEKKQVDIILCKSITRFVQNSVDCLEYIKLLKSLGIVVIFEKENINTLTAQGELILSLYSSLSQTKNGYCS